MKEMILKLKSMLATLTLDDAKKAEIEAQIVALEKESAKTPTQPPTPGATSPEMKALMDRLDASDQKNKELFDALSAERTARENSQKTIAEQVKADAAKKIADKVTEGKKAGRITPAQEPKFKALLEKDFENACAIIDALPVDPAAKAAAEKADGTGDGKQKTGDQKVFGLGKNGSPMLDKILEQAQVDKAN